VAKITWLASYPKSGNTWLRLFLANYLRTDAASVDINALDLGSIVSRRRMFEECTGLEASELTPEEIERLRPAVYRLVASVPEETIFMKVHDAFGLTSDGEPLFPPDITKVVVYLIRNPLDVAVSVGHHWGLSIDQAIEHLCREDSALGGPTDRLPEQLRQRLLTWSGHVRSWLDESNLPLHVVRYEDLSTDAIAGFSGIISALQRPIDSARVARTVALVRFDRLQTLESAHGFRERGPGSTAPFFRQGLVGGWRTALTPSQVDRIVGVHAETMQRFGYLDARGTPV
jgi:hypothetical protein